VVAQKSNFVTTAFGQRRPLGPGTPFDLADKQIASRVDFALAHAGVIAGRILDEFGDPVPEVQVSTMRYSYVNGQRRLTSANGRGVTNDIGEFRLFGLAPGDYFVAATLPSYGTPDGDDRSGYGPTYYPGTGNVGGAQSISIAPGQTVAGVTMMLQPARTWRISGIVIDASGKPATGGFVQAAPRIGMVGVGGTGGPVRDNGRFTIAGVTPGDYVLRANIAGGGNPAIAPVSVDAADVNDVQLIVMPPATLSGRIVFDSEVDVPKGTAVQITAQRPDPLFGVGLPLGGAAKADFTFEFKAAAGRALLRASQPSPNWRLKRVLLNGDDVTDGTVDIPAGAALSNIVIEFTNKLNELSGTIAGGGEPLDGWVVVFAQDSRRWTAPSRWVVPARPGRESHFKLKLMAGAYYAIAVDDVEPGEWTDPAFLARVRERATPFSIADGEAKSIELNVSASR
jgi:hypothetical protein